MTLRLPPLLEGVAQAIMPKQNALQSFDTKPQNPDFAFTGEDFTINGFDPTDFATFDPELQLMHLQNPGNNIFLA